MVLVPIKLIECNCVYNEQESCAVARKPRDAAAVLFGLKFADNVRYKFKTIAKLRKPGFRAPNIPARDNGLLPRIADQVCKQTTVRM